MNKLSVAVASLMLVAAGAAFADDPTLDTAAAVPSVKTREQVQTELAQAKQDGSIKVWSIAYNDAAKFRSVKTRDQVVAELKAAQANGEYATLNSEDSGSFALAHGRKSGDVSRNLAQASVGR